MDILIQNPLKRYLFHFGNKVFGIHHICRGDKPFNSVWYPYIIISWKFNSLCVLINYVLTLSRQLGLENSLNIGVSVTVYFYDMAIKIISIRISLTMKIHLFKTMVFRQLRFNVLPVLRSLKAMFLVHYMYFLTGLE